jgi:hypothetical protein
MTHKKVLFILKRREDYNIAIHSSHPGLSTGLFNSATFINELLKERGIESHLVIVHDNNDIDREVNNYKPTHVVIEALWVVPEKFSVLMPLHPNVKWIIRLHSEVPFLAGEGMAFDWLGRYLDYKNVMIACNAPRMLDTLKIFLKGKYTDKFLKDKVLYFPNYYPQTYKNKKFKLQGRHIDIGCFGAIRPLKNQVTQALAALEFAELINRKLKFHINVGRVEMNGSPILNNIRGIFDTVRSKGHLLVEHTWTSRDEFLTLCASMDIGLQVSFSETFNIVAADFISQGVPFIGSSEIPWSSVLFNASPTEQHSIFSLLIMTYTFPGLNVWMNQNNLKSYTNKSAEEWVKYFTI